MCLGLYWGNAVLASSDSIVLARSQKMLSRVLGTVFLTLEFEMALYYVWDCKA